MSVVTFKLPEDLFERLSTAAQESSGMSPHQCAKQIVTDHLQDTERNRIREELAELRRELLRLREDFATAVAALLIRAGKVPDAQEALAWVQDNLLPPS